jgi:hypothetical protein
MALLFVALPLQAFAALGAHVDSIQADQAHLQAQLTVIAKDGFKIHELTSNFGTVVREYVSPEGTVFAVSWQGPFMPDMRRLLATYFERYSSAAEAQRGRRVGRSPLDIHVHSLVVQTAGHMRAYVGRAYDSGLLPAGVRVEDIR